LGKFKVRPGPIIRFDKSKAHYYPKPVSASLMEQKVAHRRKIGTLVHVAANDTVHLWTASIQAMNKPIGLKAFEF
jgi:hypothetical protein